MFANVFKHCCYIVTQYQQRFCIYVCVTLHKQTTNILTTQTKWLLGKRAVMPKLVCACSLTSFKDDNVLLAYCDLQQLFSVCFNRYNHVCRHIVLHLALAKYTHLRQQRHMRHMRHDRHVRDACKEDTVSPNTYDQYIRSTRRVHSYL